MAKILFANQCLLIATRNSRGKKKKNGLLFFFSVLVCTEVLKFEV